MGIPGWRSGLAPAFGPGRDPGDPGSNPTSGSQCMEPASPSACVSASSLCLLNKKKDQFLYSFFYFLKINLFFIGVQFTNIQNKPSAHPVKCPPQCPPPSHPHPLPGSGHSSSKRCECGERKGQSVRPTKETPLGTEDMASGI